jgi:hypothetical protein
MAAGLDWQRTGNEYSVAEYIKQTDEILANMQEGSERIAAQQIRDIIVSQWDDLKNETKLLLQQTGDISVETLDQFCWIVDEGLYRALGFGSDIATSSDQAITGQMIDVITTSIHNVAQGVEAAAHLLAVNADSMTESLNFQMQTEDQAIYDNFIAQGEHLKAAAFKMEKEMHHHMQENPRIEMIREKIIHNLKHPMQFFGKTARGTLGTANFVKDAAFKTIEYNLSSPAEQRAMQNQLQNQYDNLIQTIKDVTPEQLDEFVTDVTADIATLKIFNIIKQTGRDTISQPPSSKQTSGTDIAPRQKQLPPEPRPFAKQETPLITQRHLAAKKILTDQNKPKPSKTTQKETAAKIEQQKMSRSGRTTTPNKQTQVDKGKAPAVNQKNKFKGAVEEPAQRTGQVAKQPNTSSSSSNTKPDAVQKFEQKYAKYRTHYETVAETDEKARIPYPKDWQKWDEWAEDAYDAIRSSSDDVTKIAKNTGMPEAKISRIKDHLFYDKTHILPREGRTGRFSPDHEIAAAWERLTAGDFIENDIQLLEHEYFESRFEKIFKTNYDVAHDKTQFPSKGRPWYEPNYKD